MKTRPTREFSIPPELLDAVYPELTPRHHEPPVDPVERIRELREAAAIRATSTGATQEMPAITEEERHA